VNQFVGLRVLEIQGWDEKIVLLVIEEKFTKSK